MRKIVFHLNDLEFGGAQRVVVTLANYFVRNGYQVFLATEWIASKEFPIGKEIQRVDVGLSEKQRKAGRIVKIFYRVKNLRDFLRKENPDIVISFATTANYRAVVASLFTKIPVIISIRNNPFKYYANWRDKLAITFLLPNAEGAVFQTEAAKCFFPVRLQKKSKVILNPINGKYVNREPRVKRRKVVVHSGRLEDCKNQLMLIDSFVEVHKKYPEYKLEIYGGDSKDGTKELIEKRIHNYCADEYILLMGVSDKLEEQLEDAMVYAFSSNDEGLPNALMEAMALGLPVVATDCPCGGPRTLIQNGINGLLIPVNDSNAMTKGLLKLLEDREFAENMGKEAKKLGQEASEDIICGKWMEYVESVCER